MEESGLKFDFPNCRQFGEQAPISCMKNVDFVVELENELWFIEVKNVHNSNIPLNRQQHEKERAEEKFNNRSLFSNELGPKFRDSYLYLHLDSKLSDKDVRYFVILEGYIKSDRDVAIANKELAVTTWLNGPEGKPWPEKYLKSAQVMTVDIWNDYHFTRNFPIIRIAQLKENKI